MTNLDRYLGVFAPFTPLFGCYVLFGRIRFLVLCFMFSLISQYTRCTRLWLKRYPSSRIRSKHFQKPQRGRLAMTSLMASITSRSRANRSTFGRYNTVRDRPTKRQARALDRRCSVTITATAACFASGVTTFGRASP